MKVSFEKHPVADGIDLANMALDVLLLQRKYFQAKRVKARNANELLVESKDMEHKLESMAREYIRVNGGKRDPKPHEQIRIL